MNYQVVAKQIFKELGGKDNIEDVTHCATRLRLRLKKKELVNADEIKKILGVKGIIRTESQYQIVIGSEVTGVYKAFIEILDAHTLREQDDTDEKAEIRLCKEITYSEIIYAPLSGEAVPISEVDSPAFADEIIGKGIAIIPNVGWVVAPVDGRIESVFDSKQAVAIQSSAGAEILIHVGIDTVKLEGEYFEILKRTGDIVEKGEVIINFDMDKIQQEGYSLITPVIVTNCDEYELIEARLGKITSLDELIRIY